jgi:hypothetical protein
MANATLRYQEFRRKKKEENSFPVTCPRGVAPVTSPHRQLIQQTLYIQRFYPGDRLLQISSSYRTNGSICANSERAYKYQQTPPPKSWDGVWTMIAK